MPLFCMSIRELKRFVEAEKLRSLELQNSRVKRKRHALLPGEFFHKSLAVKRIEGSGNGVVTVDEDLRIGTVIVQAKGVCSDSIDIADLFVGLLTKLSSSDRETRKESRTVLQNCRRFCPNPVPQDLLEKVESRRKELEKLSKLYPKAMMGAEDMLKLLVKFHRNGFTAGVFPLAAYFNHSCTPNCAHHYNPVSRMYEVRTIEDIRDEGTELTISYLAEARWYLPTDQRRTILQGQYGFHCMCRRCNRSSAQCTKSILAAELGSECARCQLCDNANNFCFALDDHQGNDLPGYTPCKACGKENDAEHLDSLFLEAYYGLNNSLTLPEEQCEKLLIGLYDNAKHWLHPSHWILYKLHDSLQHISKELAINTRNKGKNSWNTAVSLDKNGDRLEAPKDTGMSEYAQHVSVHRKHSLLLLNCIGTFHANENLSCVIKERAASAIRTYVSVMQDESPELIGNDLDAKRLLAKAAALEREAIRVQKSIRGLI